MTNNIKEQITNDLKQAKEAGQLKASRIREIVQNAVSQVTDEFKSGSTEIRSLVKDAVAAVVENVQQQGEELKENITASIEGAIDGVTSLRRKANAKTHAEVRELQAKLDSEEEELQQEIERLLGDIEETGKDTSPNIRAAIESAISTLKNSEEAALLQKRYAQLQAQLAILRANLAARYGGRYEDVKEYLDDAKNWYNKTRTQAEPIAEQVEQKRSLLEEKMGDAGVALAKKERQIKRILSELLQTATDYLRDKKPPTT
ncbi:histidine kinase [Chroococcidiopsis sp. TS-821]|uniref:histidine kinase n=1 Tax=Chroococcidiopsis sp. TS-821 TaxID=1378066 RepID=UPI000CEF52E8|nr:histidine kinase [Chroococcidiopsis sp. TS-821]PPS39599.1 histidine kinase [Chroococcidiopsis sp. TS-821]